MRQLLVRFLRESRALRRMAPALLGVYGDSYFSVAALGLVLSVPVLSLFLPLSFVVGLGPTLVLVGLAVVAGVGVLLCISVVGAPFGLLLL